MWEGGVVEDLTALQFLLGAVVFALCALRRDQPVISRCWFGLYAVAELVLLGEETNYGRGTLFLDLADPDFAARYNPQAENIHNVVFAHAIIPIIMFFVICLALRRFYAQLAPRLRLPMSRDFLDAILVTAFGVPFMAGALLDERFLAVDEVYEWSSSLLLLCLGLYFRFGWVFRPREGEVGCRPGRGVS